MPTAEEMRCTRRDSFLPFSLPTIGDEEIAEVVDSLRSGWVTTGPKTKRFEDQFRDYVSSKHAIAVNSCTAGLHIALTALGIGPGDEVIVPTLTFCSTSNVVVHLGAKPVLVDVGEDFNVKPECIKAAITPHTKAIMPVHFGGQACELEAIYDTALRHNLPIVEDAAHAVGSTYHGYKIGSDAIQVSSPKPQVTGPNPAADDLRPVTCSVRHATVFSFYATKNMTTGEGGMITTADDELAEWMRSLSLHGMSKDAWKRYTTAGSWYYEVVAPGYKDNMTDIQAAMGIHQLRKLDGFIEARQKYTRMYDEAFTQMPELETPVIRPDRNHVYHLYAIRLCLEQLTIDRAQFIEELKARNIGSSVHFIPVHLHPYYQQTFGYKKGDLPQAEYLYERIVSLPLFPKMTEEDVQDVIVAVKAILHEKRR